MNRTPRLSKSGIEYLDYVWNFYSGCENWRNGICPVGENCWAKGITVRFPDHYPDGFKPTYYPDAFLSPLYLNKPSTIGCAFMGDLFGDWVDPNRLVSIPKKSEIELPYYALRKFLFSVIEQCPQHTFLFKTKCPWNLSQWSPFPDNCYVGATVCNDGMMTLALTNLANIEARVKFVSIEPHLGFISMKSHPIKGILNWIIDGAQTKPYKPPKLSWVEEILEAADKAGIPVFLKDNLKPLLTSALNGKDVIESHNLWAFKYFKLRQEMPIG